MGRYKGGFKTEGNSASSKLSQQDSYYNQIRYHIDGIEN